MSFLATQINFSKTCVGLCPFTKFLVFSIKEKYALFYNDLCKMDKYRLQDLLNSGKYKHPFIWLSITSENKLLNSKINGEEFEEFEELCKCDEYWGVLKGEVCQQIHLVNALKLLGLRNFVYKREESDDIVDYKYLEDKRHYHPEAYEDRLMSVGRLSFGNQLPINKSMLKYLEKGGAIKKKISVIVKEDENGYYYFIKDGRHRYIGSLLCGFETIPCRMIYIK
jgi:hypothetical protein